MRVLLFRQLVERGVKLGNLSVDMDRCPRSPRWRICTPSGRWRDIRGSYQSFASVWAARRDERDPWTIVEALVTVCALLGFTKVEAMATA